LSRALTDVAVRLHPDDEVAIARTALAPGERLRLPGRASAYVDDTELIVQQTVPPGHKLAVQALDFGAPVHRYGQVIGFASQAIHPGEHVHTHNLSAAAFPRPAGADFLAPVEPLPLAERRTFQGYTRAWSGVGTRAWSGVGTRAWSGVGTRAWSGVGTRNYLAVVPSVNCSADVCVEIARHFTPEQLAAFPHVDGVAPFVHQSGCTLRIGSPNYRLLQRTLAGIIRHPNVGGVLLVGLGCECNQIADLLRNHALEADAAPGGRIRSLVIQEVGGSRKAVAAGIAAVEALLPLVDAARRTPQPLSELKLALQCGGSDSWSGVTANPLLGLVTDELVRQGGTAVLSETPEIYGAEHLLAGRAINAALRDRLLDKVRWWEGHARHFEMELDNNPTPGNKAGGITTIYEKSLGALAKGGHTPLTAFYEYAEPVTARGLVFMDTPGYDPVSLTGQVAGGCTVALFTTGRGSGLGGKPAPVLKVCSNSATYRAMPGDIDFNAGVVLEGVDLPAAAADLLELVIRVASGEPTQSERQGFGDTAFIPWSLGGTL
jgi:altronate hydrolase